MTDRKEKEGVELPTEFSNPPGLVPDDAPGPADEAATPPRSVLRGGLMVLVGGMVVLAGIQEMSGEPPRSADDFLRRRRLVARTQSELLAWLRRNPTTYAMTRTGHPVRLHTARGPRGQGRLQVYAGNGVWRPHVPVAWSSYYQGPAVDEDLGW